MSVFLTRKPGNAAVLLELTMKGLVQGNLVSVKALSFEDYICSLSI